MRLNTTEQHLLFSTVDEAVKKFFPVNPAQACYLYASLGCVGANYLVGDPNYYQFYAGTSRLRISKAISWDMVAHHPEQYELIGIPKEPERMIALSEPNKSKPNGMEFHAWFGVIDKNPETREFRYVEAVDFTTQYFQSLVTGADLSWERESMPQFVWTDDEGLEKLEFELWILNGFEMVLLNKIQRMPLWFEAWNHIKNELSDYKKGHLDFSVN